jgi:hypothetical protein
MFFMVVLLFSFPRRGNRTLLGQVAETLGRFWEVCSQPEMATSKSEMSSSKREMNGGQQLNPLRCGSTPTLGRMDKTDNEDEPVPVGNRGSSSVTPISTETTNL